MADQITITIPEIVGVTLTPNPVSSKGSLSVAVTVKETTRTLTPFPLHSGEAQSGES